MITFAAIRTQFVPSTNFQPARIAVTDGNRDRRIFVKFDASLGLVEAHREALVAFLGDLAHHADIYNPGYLEDGYVWTRPAEGAYSESPRLTWDSVIA